MLTKKIFIKYQKKNKKIKNKKKFKKLPLRMTQGKQQPKFERNPCLRFRGVTDDGRTDDRRMTDKFQFHELC